MGQHDLSRRGLLASAAALAATPAAAVSPGLRKVVTLSTGGGAPAPDIDLDFANAAYSSALTSVMSTGRTGTNATDLLYTDEAGAAYNTYAAGVLRVKAGQGLLLERGRTNLLTSPLAPATQTVTVSTGVHCLWMNGPGQVDLTAGTATISTTGTARQGTFFTFTVTGAGTVVVTPVDSPRLFQLEATNIGEPSSFVVGTRASDSAQLINAAATLMQASIGTIIFDSSGIPNVSGVAFVNSAGKTQLGNNANNLETIRTANGTNAVNGTLGFGTTLSVPFKAGLRWNASNRGIVGNGGTIASTTGSANFSSNIFVGGQESISQFMNRPIQRIRIWARELNDTDFTALTAIAGADSRIAAWGDSLGVLFQKLPAMFSPVRVVSGGSYAGKNSTYIKNQMLASTSTVSWINIWLTARNDGPLWDIPTILANDAAMVAATTSGKTLIGTITNSHGEKIGTSAHANIVSANNARVAAHPNNVVDTRAAIVAAYDPANPMDVIDNANDVPPYSKRQDIAAGTITQALNSSDTSFTISASGLASNTVIKVDSEYINILSMSGNTVTSSTRGYAGTAASHSNGAAYTGKDPTHFNNDGNIVLAGVFHDGIIAKGW